MRFIALLALTGLTVVNAQSTSTSGRCGAQFGLTCSGSTFGSCCSQYNYCGKSSAHCGQGCQSGYGTCTTNQDGSTKVSTDGRCGGSKGQTCLNSAFGNCCSSYGYCGRWNAHCGSGCNPAFGTCNNVVSSDRGQSSTHAPSATPSSTEKVSTNARCGFAFGASPGGMTCLDSKYGNCCSQYGFCGRTSAYCSTGCQTGFGKCDGVSSSVTLPTTLATSSRSSSAQSSTPSSVRSASSSTRTSTHYSSTQLSSASGSSTRTSSTQTSSSSASSSVRPSSSSVTSSARSSSSSATSSTRSSSSSITSARSSSSSATSSVRSSSSSVTSARSSSSLASSTARSSSSSATSTRQSSSSSVTPSARSSSSSVTSSARSSSSSATSTARSSSSSATSSIRSSSSSATSSTRSSTSSAMSSSSSTTSSARSSSSSVTSSALSSSSSVTSAQSSSSSAISSVVSSSSSVAPSISSTVSSSTRSPTPTPSACVPVDLQNTGFESGVLGPWTQVTNGLGDASVTVRSPSPLSGQYAVYFQHEEVQDDANFHISQRIRICPGTPYLLSFSTLLDSEHDDYSCTVNVCIDDVCTGGINGGAYQVYEYGKTHIVNWPGSTKSEIEIQIGNDRPNDQFCLGNIYLDDINFVAQEQGGD